MSQEDDKAELSRREALKIAAAGLIGTLPLSQAFAKNTANHHTSAAHGKNAAGKSYLFLQKQEAAFLEAAVSRLIPSDEKWGGALEAGVVNYIDLQLGGSWGAGERLYRSGPWAAGTPSQGYQLPFTPAELFRAALRGIDQDLKTKKIVFETLPPLEQDNYLKALEKSTDDLNGVPGKVFFNSLWQMTLEGFFADPTYGGNKDMVSWKMIGFPGAYASYYDLVDKHGIKLKQAPMSLDQDSMGHMHMHPDIPARE